MALTVKVGTNLPELNKEIKALSTNAKLSSQQLKTLDTNLKFRNLKTIDNLKDKQNLLKNAISDTSKQVTLLNSKYDELAKQKGIDPNRLARVQVEIERTKQNLVVLNTELKRTNQEIAKVNGKKFLDLENKIGSLGKKMIIGLSLPITGIIAALAKLTTSTIKQGDEIAKTANKLEISAESLQKFQYIAERSGTSFDTLKRSFSIINKISSDISKGINNNATNAFKELGISVTDANGKLKSSDAIFLELQKALSGIGDQGKKNSIIFELFGTRMGTELQDILGLTDEEMKKLMDSAEGLGIISNDSAKKSEELADKLTDMKQKVNALKITIASSLLPIFENIVDFISTKFIPAISKITNLFTNLNNNTKQWIFNILGIMAAIRPALLIFSKLSGIFGTLINVFNLAKIAVTAFGISFNVATAGIGILIGVLAALLLKNEQFRATLGDLLNMLVTLLQPVLQLVNVLITALKPVLSFIVSILNTFVAIVAKVASAIVKFLITPFNFLIKVINLVIKGINLLLKGLKVITFGLVDIQIPEIPKINANNVSNNTNGANNNVQNNNVSFNNNFQITKEADANQVVDVINNQLGNTLR